MADAGPGKFDFAVDMSTIKCKDLPSMDLNGSSDPYLKISFDGWHEDPIRTETIHADLNPIFAFSRYFAFCPDGARSEDDLKSMFFRIEVWDWDKVSRDDFIGSVELSFHTLATGPRDHELTLRTSSGKAAGTIQFSIGFQQITHVSLQIRTMAVELADPQEADMYLSIACLENAFDTQVEMCVTEPSWERFEKIRGDFALPDILDAVLQVQLKCHDDFGSSVADSVMGTAQIPIRKYFALQNAKLTEITEPLMSGSDEVGTLTGSFYFNDLPKLCQLKTGKHTDAGFEDVEVVFKGARLPVGLIDMGGEQPVSMRRNTASSTIGSGIIGSTIVSTATQGRR